MWQRPGHYKGLGTNNDQLVRNLNFQLDENY